MAVTNLDITFDDKKAHDAVMRLQRRVEDPSKPRGSSVWDRVLDAVLAANSEQFASQGSGFWPPLKPKYAKWKSAHGGGTLLVLSGGLKASFTEKGAQGQKVTMTASQFRFRSDYGKPGIALAFKTYTGHGKTPARPEIWLGTIYPKVKESLVTVAQEWERTWAQ